MLERVTQALRTAQHVTVLTGAGASAESGLLTFRDKQTGLRARFDPMELATPEAFDRDPATVWSCYEYRCRLVLQAEPNDGRRAIAELERRVPRLTLITMTVDHLHERAGSDPVVHVHGQLLRSYCSSCRCSHTFPPGLLVEHARIRPPRCKACGGRVRPGVVMFGDEMPRGSWVLQCRFVELGFGQQLTVSCGFI